MWNYSEYVIGEKIRCGKRIPGCRFVKASGQQERSESLWRRLVNDLAKFVPINLGQGFAAALELLKRLNDRLCYAIMGFGRTTNNRKLFSDGDPLVTIGIVESYAQKVGVLLLLIAHGV
jgi:hypothetical protein